MIIIISGLPGSGKTYFAKHLAKKLNTPHINSDLIRKKIFPNPTYTSEEKQIVYNTLKDKLDEAIIKKGQIIIDATFTGIYKNYFIEKSRQHPDLIFWIEIRASENTIKERLSKTRPDSDADYNIYLLLKQQYSPIPIKHMTLYSDEENISNMVNQTLSRLKINE